MDELLNRLRAYIAQREKIRDGGDTVTECNGEPLTLTDLREAADAIEALRAEVDRCRVTCREWLDKTEWVQQTLKPRELGHHRADIVRQRIKHAEARVKHLTEALRIAEAALADIGDADREPGDDLEWCERRAQLGLRRVRDTLQDHDQEVGNG